MRDAGPARQLWGSPACVSLSLAARILWQSSRALGWLLQGDELGYFAFGGSTVIAVFARNQIAIDEDLLHNRCVSLKQRTSDRASKTGCLQTPSSPVGRMAAGPC